MRKLIATPFMVLATIMYMLGIVTREDLYRFIGSIDPELRAKLEEEDEKEGSHVGFRQLLMLVSSEWRVFGKIVKEKLVRLRRIHGISVETEVSQ